MSPLPDQHEHDHAGQRSRPSDAPGSHAHDASLEVALDFVNTRELTRDGFVDHLPDLPAALSWLREHGLLHGEAVEEVQWSYASDAEARAHVLRRIKRLRGALRDLLEATVERRLPSAQALDQVNRALAARHVQVLVPGRDGVSLDHRHRGDPVEEALSRIAGTIADEVSATDARRLRICANDECRWVFKDESPGARRKWCSMAVCGNRAKVARHRQRQKQPNEGSAS